MKKTATFFSKEKKESIKLSVHDIYELSAPFISDASDNNKKGPFNSKFKANSPKKSKENSDCGQPVELGVMKLGFRGYKPLK